MLWLGVGRKRLCVILLVWAGRGCVWYCWCGQEEAVCGTVGVGRKRLCVVLLGVGRKRLCVVLLVCRVLVQG